METDRLRQLKVLVLTESLTDAARTLGMTPGALSKSMVVLSSQLGTILYENAGRGLKITQQARQIAEASDAILSSLDKLTEVNLAPQIQSDRLRFGSFEVFTGKLARFFLGEYPEGTRLEMHELLPGEIEDSLVTNKIDIGVTYQPVPRTDVSYVKASKLTMKVYGRPKFHKMSLEDLPFLIPMPEEFSGVSRSKGLDGWDDLRYPRHIIHKVTLLETGLQFVAAGNAVIYAPSFVVRLHNELSKASERLESIDVKVPARMGAQDVFIVCRKGDEDSAWVRRTAKILRKYCK